MDNNDNNDNIVDYLKSKINQNEEVKKVKAFHASFSSNNIFDKNDTFVDFDVEKHGAFHAACDNNNDNSAEQIAQNRVFVKILEDAMKTKNINPMDLSKIILEHSIDLALLNDKYGYKLKGDFNNPIMIEVEIKYSNALELNENRTGQWTPFDIIREVFNEIELGKKIEGFTAEDLKLYYEDGLEMNGVKLIDLDCEDYAGEEYNKEYKELLFVRDWLESKGYDAIKYNNKFEGEGECIISFRPENVEVVNSHCLKHLIEKQEFVQKKLKIK